MIANNTGAEARRLFNAFPDRLGHIYSPGGWREPWGTYALDNGAFVAWTSGQLFDEAKFLKLCNRAKLAAAPAWVAVPDVVTEREATLANWRQWHPKLEPFGWPLAFVVQNGMTPIDVPHDAAVIFVGGSTEWKWETVAMWCAHFPRVHVGRVNTERLLWQAHRAGAESCDGSGWFRGCRKQLDGLWYYLSDSSGAADLAHGPMQSRFHFATLAAPRGKEDTP